MLLTHSAGMYYKLQFSQILSSTLHHVPVGVSVITTDSQTDTAIPGGLQVTFSNPAELSTSQALLCDPASNNRSCDQLSIYL